MTVLLVLLGTILALPTTTNAQLVFQEEAADPDFKTLIKTYEPGKNFSHQSIVLKTSVLTTYGREISEFFYHSDNQSLILPEINFGDCRN